MPKSSGFKYHRPLLRARRGTTNPEGSGPGERRLPSRLVAATLAAIVGLSMIAAMIGMVPAASAGECNGANHGPVLITSDEGFTAANGVISGTGTPSSPYQIANMAIGDMRQGYALKIDNSAGTITKSFAITCISSNWKMSTPSGGFVVWIVNIHTPTTISLVLSNSGELPHSGGLLLQDSSNIILNNESFNKMGGDGIELVMSDHITVLDSKSKAAGEGLHIVDSHDILVGQTCSVGGGQGCDEFTYDDDHGLLVQNSYNIQVVDTITSSDDSGGVVLSGTGTYNVVMTGGTATANGPICHAGIASGYVSDIITGIAAVNGAHDITVHGYTLQANGDGGGGYFDIMDGGKGLYLSPCGGLTILPATPPGGANLNFSGNCYRFEFGFTSAPASTC